MHSRNPFENRKSANPLKGTVDLIRDSDAECAFVGPGGFQRVAVAIDKSGFWEKTMDFSRHRQSEAERFEKESFFPRMRLTEKSKRASQQPTEFIR